MPEIDQSNIVGMLRGRTEKTDLQQYLRSIIGGYTKKSVMEYLTALRKYQQATAETFNNNLQMLFEEKESLKADNEILLSRLTKVETEYQSLSEAMITYNLENEDYVLQDIISLKNTVAALEAEIKKITGTNCENKKEIERLIGSFREKETELQKSKQETQIQRELLIAEKTETKKNREQIAELSDTVRELRDETQYLKGIVSDGKIAEFNTRIKELIANVTTQEEIIDCKDRELSEKEIKIEMFTEENAALKQSINYLSRSVDTLMVQNEKLISANRATAAMLEETNKNAIALIIEKSDAIVEKLIAGRKLDEAKLKLSMLKMEEGKLSNSERIRRISAHVEIEEDE